MSTTGAQAVAEIRAEHKFYDEVLARSRRGRPISAEDFELWRANPVTEAVLGVLMRLADASKDRWLQASWTAPVAAVDPVLLTELRTRHQTYMDVVELTFEELEAKQNDVEAGAG